ncbi:SsrA-binding protein SmpB [Williamsoniiplasma lucivorax]|uniref:SsrA-binding protein n=1 Tax=Williamsoniiplasma lucivorax TaxID=209274 RepID=A0A2S5RES7_9MOLU|nr:SsrA-binding protein SmpB [Williamsoniiplasma lucivorax]PPE05810.1 SsrA-binding protein [Williamsoniiplasma lucivorax]
MGEMIIAQNKKAYFNYEILEKIEAGLVLSGPEIKSIRARDVSLEGSFILIRKDECFILNMHIKKYEYANYVAGIEEDRTRKLLLHRKQIKRLEEEVKLKKLALIPLKLYFKDGLVKLEIGLGKGKKLYDKRETIKKRDLERKIKTNKY